MPPGRVLIALLAVAACGGDDGATTPLDGAIVADAFPGDASVDDCYREGADDINGDVGEPTGLVVGGVARAICGDVAVVHPGPAGLLDRDRFAVTLVTPAAVVIRLSAPGAVGLERLQLDVTTAGGAALTARAIGGLGVAIALLPSGTHELAVSAFGASGGAIPYRLVIAPDDPAARCPLAGGGPDYREADETEAGHRANDMVAVHVAPLSSAATPSTSDRPEDTQRAVSSVGRVVLAGDSADVTPAGDDYHDRDAFAVYTGQTTNFLELRAGWSGAADLDVLVFEAEQPDAPLGTPTATVAGELVVATVKPATLYWVWIGGSTRSAALPATYELAVCGRELTPDAP